MLIWRLHNIFNHLKTFKNILKLKENFLDAIASLEPDMGVSHTVTHNVKN